MLKNIHIQNYRGIKDLKIKDFKRINLFVGDNNSGKTSVIEAIAILQPNLKTLFNTILLREMGGSILVKTGSAVAEIELGVNLQNISNQFYEKNTKEPFVISADFIGADRKLIKKSLKARLTSDYIQFDQPTGKPEQSIEEINSFVAEYSFGGKSERLGLSRNGTGKMMGENFGILHSFISDIPPKRSQLIRKFLPIVQAGRKQEYVEVLKEFEPGLETIDQAGDDLVFGKKGRPPVSLSYMGSGFVRFLDIFLTTDAIGKNLAIKSAILCIDEIDNGLHHSKQEHFWKTIFAFLKKSPNLQIFATTHSDESVAALSRVYEEADKEDLGEDAIRLFKIKKDSAETIHALRYNSNMIRYAVEDEAEIR
jgi:AAA15 family ATPase/GTPase